MENNFAPTLVRASAGSGKTYSLTNRLIALLVAGEKVERILATTFTKKAAGEILERLLQRVALAAIDEREAKTLGKDICVENFSSKMAAELLERLTLSQHRLQIATLDSFFIKIAKSFPLELSLPLVWEIADPARVRELRNEAIAAVFEKSNDPVERAQFFEILKDTQQKGVGAKLHTAIDKVAIEMHRFFESSSAQAWQGLTVDGSNLVDQAELVALLANVELPQTKAGKPHANWQKEFDRVIAELGKPSPDYGSIVEKGIGSKLVLGELSYSRVEIPEQIRELFYQLLLIAKFKLLQQLKTKTESLYKLLERFDGEFRKIKALYGVLLFDDVKRCLAQYGQFDDVRELYFRLDATVRHILLDEFQDTSLQEWQILEPLVDEVLSYSDFEHTFYCVGDVKQAIYGWRGGESAIFDLLKQRYGQLKPDSKNHSYRSSSIIIEFVNSIFSNLSESTALNLYPEVLEYWQQRFESHTTEKTDLPGYVSLELISSELSNQEFQQQRDLRVVELVQQIISKNKAASIAVLYRKNDSIARMIYLLRNRNIAASEEGGNPLTDSKAVTVILSLLRLAEHPDDTVARFCVVNSPLGAFLDLEDVSDHKRADQLSLLVREMIADRGLVESLNYFAKPMWKALDRRDSERLKQFLEVADSYRMSSTNSLSQFIKYVEDKKVESGHPATVRVMTIHKSKGLEFDAVILPELEQSLTGAIRPDILVGRGSITEPINLILSYPSKALQLLDPRLKELVHQQQAQAVQESLAVLYVAITRAKQALYIVAKAPKDNSVSKSSAGLVLETLNLSQVEFNDQIKQVYQLGESNWVSSSEPVTDQPQLSIKDISLSLTTPSQRSKQLFNRAPSQHAEDEDITDIFTRTTNPLFEQAKERGVLIHQLLERIEWIDQPKFDEEKFRQEVSLLINSEPRREILESLLETLRDPVILKLFEKGERTELYRELPFAYREKDTLYRGVIDRISAKREGGQIHEIEVIDFKSDQIQSSDLELLEQRIEHYRPQLEVYRRAAARLFKVQFSQVKAKLLFLQPKKIIEL